MEKIILASGSPRRKELLEQAGISFTIKVSEADETITKKEPWEAVMELAARKARAVAESGLEEEDVIVIGADTVVAVDGKILGKPHSKEEGRGNAAPSFRESASGLHWSGTSFQKPGKLERADIL